LAGGAALYAYVNRPEIWVDPLGLSCNNQAKTREDRPGRWRDEKGRFAKHPGWPSDFGFEPNLSSLGVLPLGKRIDRYGHPGGEFVADLGTPFEQRALPASTARKNYQEYEVIKEIPNVRSGPTAPWFGQPGMGIQHQLPKPVQYYLDNEYLKKL
jgi:hypothetical protein